MPQQRLQNRMIYPAFGRSLIVLLSGTSSKRRTCLRFSSTFWSSPRQWPTCGVAALPPQTPRRMNLLRSAPNNNGWLYRTNRCSILHPRRALPTWLHACSNKQLGRLASCISSMIGAGDYNGPHLVLPQLRTPSLASPILNSWPTLWFVQDSYLLYNYDKAKCRDGSI